MPQTDRCARCHHPQDWHRHDDRACLSTHPQPCAPAGCGPGLRHPSPYRCLGYDCMGDGVVAGTPESRCGCPDYVEPGGSDAPVSDREAQARELASELEWRFRLRSDTAPAQTFGDCMTLILAYGDRRAADTTHLCSGCHHRWNGPLKGAELCGDCWRQAQSVVFSAPPREEPEG